MQHAVDSDLRLPDAVESPDRGYRQVLRDPLPKADEEVVAHARLHAKRGGLDDPSRVVPGEAGLADNGRIRISGDHGERIEVDPAKARSLARPARYLDTHASVQALQEPRQAPAQTQDQSRKQGTCVMTRRDADAARYMAPGRALQVRAWRHDPADGGPAAMTRGDQPAAISPSR